MSGLFKSSLISLAFAATVLPTTGRAKGIAATDVPTNAQPTPRSAAEQLFVMGNQARVAQGVRPLAWDAALAQAAQAHCERMASDGSISHQYVDEADVDVRAGQAGARFSLIEENVAVGGSSAIVHQAWMNSTHHRENLLNPQVDRVGLAVVVRGGMLYAVADFSRGVATLSPEQVEATVAALVRASGMAVHDGATVARQACATDHGMPASIDDERPEFIMRWQDSELSHLPQQLSERIATGRYRDAAIGSCEVPGGEGTFTSFRIAVLLLKPRAVGVRTMAASK